jgi:hypothetical protein
MKEWIKSNWFQIISLIVLLGGGITGFVKNQHDINEHFQRIEQQINKIENNDLTHLTMAHKIANSISVKNGDMSMATYFALWNENPLDLGTNN